MATVTPTTLGDYDWVNSDFAWNSATAQTKDWDEASWYNYDLDEAASLNFAEVAGRNVLLPHSDSFSITDQAKYDIALNVLRSLGFAETYLDVINFNLTVSENLTIAETLSNDVIMGAFYEAFSIAEAHARDIGLAHNEGLNFAEVYADSIAYYLIVAETLGISDSIAKDQTLTVAETLDLVERFIRNSDGAVGDLTVLNEAYDAAQFATAQQSAPAGFGTFEKFFPGQRRFDEALFKTVLSGAATADRPRITELTVNVDIPEIGDSGSDTLTAALKTISFNKEFYQAPEVSVVHKGGTIVAVPRVSNITTTTFDVTLEKASDGTLVAGDISWTAYGS